MVSEEELAEHLEAVLPALAAVGSTGALPELYREFKAVRV